VLVDKNTAVFVQLASKNRLPSINSTACRAQTIVLVAKDHANETPVMVLAEEDSTSM
jgi:hypothetical protein